MVKDTYNDPLKKIPHGFKDFCMPHDKSRKFEDLLQAMLDYCRELFRLENK
jgi:hypothetical protein